MARMKVPSELMRSTLLLGTQRNDVFMSFSGWGAAGVAGSELHAVADRMHAIAVAAILIRLESVTPYQSSL